MIPFIQTKDATYFSLEIRKINYFKMLVWCNCVDKMLPFEEQKERKKTS